MTYLFQLIVKNKWIKTRQAVNVIFMRFNTFPALRVHTDSFQTSSIWCLRLVLTLISAWKVCCLYDSSSQKTLQFVLLQFLIKTYC